MTDEQLLENINHIISTQLESIKTTQAEHTKILGEHSNILSEHSKILGEHSKTLGENSRDIKSLKGKVSKIDKTLNIAIKFFDEGIVANRKRIERIEDHLALKHNH